jgi:flavin-dependent dehydrogenase
MRCVIIAPLKMEEGRADTAIIGAGPAGCSAAIFLARQGFRVALVEAEGIGREKLCGEFLSPECRGLLTQLGLEDRIRSLQPADIHTARLTAPGGATCEIPLPETGWGLSRSALDAILWQGATSAGAHGLQRTQVRNVVGDLRKGFVLDTTSGTVSARTVIAAHGRRATLDRVLDRAFMRRRQPFVAIKAHFAGPELHRRVELHFFPGGYCGLAEIEGGRVNLCMLVREPLFRSLARSRREPVEAFVNWMRGQNSEVREWLDRARRVDSCWLSVAQIPFAAKRAVEREILMAGDSAGLIVPLAGDGIAMALQSGVMAARQCASFLRGERSPLEMTQGYGDEWERAFGERVRLGRVLHSLVLQPWLVGPAVRALDRAPLLAKYLVRHTRAQPAVDSSRPLH